MTPKEYVQSQLENLGTTSEQTHDFANDNELVDFIYKTLMSKKFRKFSIPKQAQDTIHSEIKERVANNEPLSINYPFGGYKLWRLEESPYPDWAELFAMIYIVRWLKPVLAAYTPGVHFAFRFDEVIVEKLNNVPVSDTDAYRKEFEKLLQFVGRFSPKNLEFEIFLERSRYDNYEQFEKELAAEIENLRAERLRNGHKLTEAEIAMIDLNVKLKPGQADTPNWREENDLVHIAYYALQNHKKHPRKHYEQEGIVAFPFYFATSNIIPIGTTKSSVAKFWAAVGALAKKDNEYREIVLSPNQLENSKYEFESVSIDGLDNKNFQKIRILN